jgi:hypothetical protein
MWKINDRVIASASRGRGQREQLTGARLVCLAVAQLLLGTRSKYHWPPMYHARLGQIFPDLPQ